jgi:lipopolysaccharide biosynthesis glycosyltransferase
MEILCACDQQYIPHTATMLCSLLEHNTDCRIHLFHNSIADCELAKLKFFVEKCTSEITFYEVEPAAFRDIRIDRWASAANYYRLLAPRLLPTSISKILYLDSDIIIRGSLCDLWNTDVADCALAAVANFWDDHRTDLGLAEGTKYFNSGVLLINLQFWRQNNVPERAISFAKENPEKVRFHDQDALNATLVHQWVEISPCLNWQDPTRRPKAGITATAVRARPIPKCDHSPNIGANGLRLRRKRPFVAAIAPG